MNNPDPKQSAKHLIKALGDKARSQAVENALAMRKTGNAQAERFWLDVLDVVLAQQTG
jgi:hypothetical protein